MKKNVNSYIFWSLLPVIVLVGGGFYFREFIVYAVSQNVALNLIIIGAAVVGAVLSFMRVWAYRKEYYAIHLFERGIKSGRDMRQMVGHARVRSTEVARIFNRLAGTDGHVRSRIDQSAIQEEYEVLKHTFEGRQEFAQHMVGVMVAFGLLGTFIGLLETLIKVSDLIGGFSNANLDNLDSAFKDLVDKLRNPLVAMGTAFSASMFGLIGSLMLGMMFITLRNATATFFNYTYDTLHRLTKIVNDSIPQSFGTVNANSADGTLASLVKHFGLPMSYTKALSDQMNKLNRVLDMQQKMIARQTQANVGMNRALSWLTDEDRKRSIDMNLPVDQMRQAIKSIMTEVKTLFKKQQEGMDGPALLCGMSVLESILKIQRLVQYMFNRVEHFPGINTAVLQSFYQSLTSHRDIMLMLVDRVRTMEMDAEMPLSEKEAIKEDFAKAVDRVNQHIQFDASRTIPDITSVLSNYSDRPLDVAASSH